MVDGLEMKELGDVEPGVVTTIAGMELILGTEVIAGTVLHMLRPV